MSVWVQKSERICENGKYLGIVIDDSVIMCVEIINAADVVSKNVPANVISIVSTNVMSTTPINFHSKKKYKMDCYILQTFLSEIILLFIIAIICYHYAKHRSKQKNIGKIAKQNKTKQGRSQNLKAVPQNLMKFFKVDDVTANDIIQKKQHRLRKKNYRFSIVITTVKLAILAFSN